MTEIAVSDPLHMLAEELRANAQLYQNDDLADQRTAVVASLAAVYHFLQGQGIPANVLAPLFRPVDALAALDRNGLDPLFTAGRKGGRPRVTEDQHNRAGILAALAAFWIEHHGSGNVLDVALSGAVRAIRGRWSGALTKAELKSARAIVSQEAPDHPAVKTAERAAETLNRLRADRGEAEAFDLFLGRLNAADADPGVGNWATLMGSSL